MSAREHIVIVGGGPIGLTAALLLARAQYRVTLVESRAAPARADRRLLALSRGTWQLLLPLLQALPVHAAIDTVIVSSAGEFGTTRISERDIDASGQPLGVTVYYGELHAALDSAVASAADAIEVRRPARLLDVAQRHDAVIATLDDGSSIIGAAMLHAEGAPTAGDTAAAWAVLADVQLQGPAAGTAFERFTREGPLALLPAASAQQRGWSLVWCATEAAVQRRVALPAAEFVTELQHLLGSRAATVVAVAGRQSVQLAPQARARIHEHRIAWLGNAAQTLHPVAGQGFNLGVRDAAALVRALTSHREQGTTDVPAALVAYGRTRAIDRQAITSLTQWLPALFATPLWPVAIGRSVALAALDAMPPLRRQWARLLMFGVRE